MSTTETALTAHLVMPWDECSPTFLHEMQDELLRRFAIDHATVQIEPDAGAIPCRLGLPGTV